MMDGLDHGYHSNVVAGNCHEVPPPVGTSKQKVRRSMDMEFHDLNLDDSDVSSNCSHRVLLRRMGQRILSVDDDPSSEEESFGEASVDCKPDAHYLQELLDEEYHPERLNLLDCSFVNRKEKPLMQRMPRKNGISTDKYEFSDSESDQIDYTEDDESDWTPTGPQTDFSDFNREYDFDLSDQSIKDEDIRSEIHDVGPASATIRYSDTDGEDGPPVSVTQDTFVGSPKRLSDPDRPSLKKQLESMESATKRSFRTVGNKSFFSQPFKSLTRSLSGGKRKPRPALEQQEVA